MTVEHTPVNSIPADADVVVCHAGLAARARVSAPGKVIVPFQIFIGDPAVDQGRSTRSRTAATVDG